MTATESFTAAVSGTGVFRFFVDLDGVMSDFDAHALAHGKRLEDGNINWKTIDQSWWATMPIFSGAKEFHGALRQMGETRFLTGPTADAGCFAGKAEWAAEHFGFKGLQNLIICPARDKHLLAAPNRILIDDMPRNIQQWTDAGGIGILHTGDFAATLAAIKQIVGGGPAPQKQPTTGHSPAP